MSDDEFFRALDAGYVPPYLAAVLAEKKALQPNGFDFSTAASSTPVQSSKAAQTATSEDIAA
jgi:hypothetical protein